MDFSVGVLYSSHSFLEVVQSTPLTSDEFPQIFRTFEVADPAVTLRIVQSCEWVSLNHFGRLQLTDAGRHVLSEPSPAGRLRVQLRDMIIASQPPWGGLLSRGRLDTMQYLPRNVLQCFREAGLFADESEAIVEWWDELARAARGRQEDANMFIGRRGERLSIAHETERLGRRPKWQALESNGAGFDILSTVSLVDSGPLRIEVKATSSRPASAYFHVSKNEWDVARISGNYIFHLWAFQPAPELRIVPADEVASHIPVNSGAGEWESTRIPYSAVWSE